MSSVLARSSPRRIFSNSLIALDGSRRIVMQTTFKEETIRVCAISISLPKALYLWRLKRVQHPVAQLLGIALTGFRERNDFSGDYFVRKVAAIPEPKRDEHRVG
jgi:hypothetical protein